MLFLIIRDILELCAGCDELNVPVRRTEKRLLNELNKQVRFPPRKKEIVRTPADKVRGVNPLACVSARSSFHPFAVDSLEHLRL